MPFTPKNVRIPADLPRIAAQVRLVDGLPMLFTERGELITGQTEINLHAGVGRITSATVTLYVEREEGADNAG